MLYQVELRADTDSLPYELNEIFRLLGRKMMAGLLASTTLDPDPDRVVTVAVTGHSVFLVRDKRLVHAVTTKWRDARDSNP